MTLKEFWRNATGPGRAELAELAGTSVNNLRNIAYGQSIGKDLAASIAAASGGEITEMELLYPERYE